jgi:long-chain fatty acid transport protein
MPRLHATGIVIAIGTLLSAPAMAGSAAFSGITASANSAETASNNPAGMARLQTASTTASLALANGFGEFKVDQAQSSPGGDPDNEFSPVLIPQGYHVRPINERLTAGISLTVPSGFGSDYGSDWAGRYQTESYSLVYIALTPAVAWRINQQWSVGASLGINYTSSESEVAFKTLAPGPSQGPDGRLSAELDGVGTRLGLSALWEMSERTRFGLVYTSESETDIDGKLKFRNPGPVVGGLLERGLLPDNLEVEQVLPQRIIGGVYHELDDGAFITADLAWIEFSKFGTSSISLGNARIDVDEGNFNNIWAGTLGYGFPASNGRQYSIGAFFVQQPVDDDKRSLALPLDRIWGVGAGVNFQRANGHSLDVNLNLADYGKAPVDTGDSRLRGRVIGETDNPYAVVISTAYHF